jgi:hypothetical protein
MKQPTGKIPQTIMVNLNLAKPVDKEIWNMIQATQQGKDDHGINYPITLSTAVKVLLADRKVAKEDMKGNFPPYANHNSRPDNTATIPVGNEAEGRSL